MPTNTLDILISIDTGSDIDETELINLTRQLRLELKTLRPEKEVALVKANDDAIPARAMAGDPITWGLLLVTLLTSGGVITTLIKAISDWLPRAGQCEITLTIDGDTLKLKGVDSVERQRLIDIWVKRHTEGR